MDKRDIMLAQILLNILKHHHLIQYPIPNGCIFKPWLPMITYEETGDVLRIKDHEMPKEEEMCDYNPIRRSHPIGPGVQKERPLTDSARSESQKLYQAITT
ncbi:hypothetical protein CDAR_607641 [Caerostris darwini]|uniref:Uncharacterized protein n=1 Tax=Caerostris darwini TaxID=1538125 RepID=A0AAV4RSK8_9ARAC|nr:hypothetical protein CDAR_607641 [Caerostris darwini]